MNTIHIPITSATHNEIIRGLAMHSNYEEFLNYFSEYVAAVEEKNLLKLFKILSVKQNLTWLDDVCFLNYFIINILIILCFS